ncbi:hypothetical protein NUKP23_19880 [Klebsiella variicola]|nr:hypothetical protein A2G95_24035 [Klebsiella quasipneumoniae subsp. similipneumoniae]GKJ06672.1 hypothetical protein NUKP23_19880 [Klebsiella variicola]CEP32459.1 conserved hypothetical protein [Klebsiella variicola]
MKMQLIGKGNLPLLTFILDGCTDDSILNISALARRLSCSRSSLLDRIQNFGFDSAVRHFINEKRKKMIN